jgi:hypothetical protein
LTTYFAVDARPAATPMIVQNEIVIVSARMSDSRCASALRANLMPVTP